MRNWIFILLAVIMAAPVGMANVSPDDDDKDPSIRPGIRRLHPERERAKAIKKLKEQMSRQADPNADPWDTSDEVWGTVDLPVAAKDSIAVQGHRLSPQSSEMEAGKRLVWQDEPVRTTIDLVMPFMTVIEGEYRSKYVSGDSVANEVYFAFDMDDDSIPGPLRLCISYCGDTPIDYDQVVFTIDGYDYFFYPMAPHHGSTNGQYWAVSDDALMHPAYKDLVYALAHGQWAMIKLQGLGGMSRVKVLTDDQLDDFANTLDLYRLMGGEL